MEVLDSGSVCFLLDAMWPLIFQEIYSKIPLGECLGKITLSLFLTIVFLTNNY